MIITATNEDNELGRVDVSNSVSISADGEIQIPDSVMTLENGGTISEFRVWSDGGHMMARIEVMPKTYGDNETIELTDLRIEIGDGE